jgi:hypothetical protein
MAFRTWVRVLLAALGMGALAGASQLGVAYGLGVVRLTRVFDAAGRDQWTAQIAWAAWFAMVAAIVGALASGRFQQRWAGPGSAAKHLDSPAKHDATGPDVPGGREPQEPDLTGRSAASADADDAAGPVIADGWLRVAVAFSAGIGAMIVVPLTMQPARTAQVTATDPAVVIGICAALGALVGAVAGLAALTHIVARWSLGTMIGAVWLIAVVSVLPSMDPQDPLPAVRLGVFDAGFLEPATTQRFALFTMPALGLLAGAGLGWMARRRGFSPVTIALAGLPGPALLTFAYLIAGPGKGGQRYQVIPYWAAMMATILGVLGAVIAAVIRHSTKVPGGTPVTPGENLLTPAENLLDAVPPAFVPATAATDVAAPATAGPRAGRPASGAPPAIGPGPAVGRAPTADATGQTGPGLTPADFTLADLAAEEPAQPDSFARHVPADSKPPKKARATPAPFAAIAPPPASPAAPAAPAPIPARRSRRRAAAGDDTGAPLVPQRPVAPQLIQPQQLSPPPPNPTPVTPPITPPAPISAQRHGGPADDRTGPPPSHAETPGRRATRSTDAPIGEKDTEFVDWVSGLGGD